MMRRVLSVAMALMLVCTLPLTTLAYDWDLSVGDIAVSVDESGTQNVSQTNGESKNDANPTISSNNQTSNTITVSTEGNTTANITIDNVNIGTSEESAIDVGDSNLNLTVKGEDNYITSIGSSGIHVSDGKLTIRGDGELNVKTIGNDAAIGSNKNEKLEGSITIKGSVTVDAESTGYGAAIGSGMSGEMDGDITIGESADVTASSSTAKSFWGSAAIGSGDSGNMNGSITIKGDAQVEANANGMGAAIGSGDNAHVGAEGSISLKGNSSVSTTNKETNNESGAAIGTGRYGYMKGTINIGENTTQNLNDGIIGAGTNGQVTGTINEGVEAIEEEMPPEEMPPEEVPPEKDPVETAPITVVSSTEEEIATKSAPLYRVVDEDEKDLPFTETRKDGVLTIHCDRDFATFLAKTVNLNILKAQGIHTIVFETENATSTFALEDISGEGTLHLTHNGTTVTFTLEDTDISEILK